MRLYNLMIMSAKFAEQIEHYFNKLIFIFYFKMGKDHKNFFFLRQDSQSDYLANSNDN